MKTTLTRLVTTSILSILLVLCASAEEQELIRTTSDKDSVVETFSIETDAKGQLARLWQRVEGKPDRSYTLEQLQKGVVLRQEGGREAVRFRAVKVEPDQGGSFRMDYLYSAVPSEQYRSMALELRKDSSIWGLFSGSDKRPIKGLHFLTNVTSFLGMKKIIGIRDVQVDR